MKRKISLILFALSTVGIAIVYTQCKPSPIVVGNTVIYPQAFPGTDVTGITFPTDSVTINKWTNDASKPGNYDSASIYQHAWGIWAGLTAVSNQIADSAEGPLLIFETWMGLNEVREYILADSTCSTGQQLGKTGRSKLTRPKQFEHAGALQKAVNTLKKSSGAPGSTAPQNLWVTVSYNPDQACHAINNKLFRQTTINNYYQQAQGTASKIGEVPQFPNNSIMIKPTYLEYPRDAKLLQMPVWLNPPNPADSVNIFPPNEFPYCVYVDVTNKQQAGKQLTPVSNACTNQDSIQGATCNLSDFISYAIDSTMAAFMNQQDSVQGMNPSGFGVAQPGNRVLLVAMHVSTKEIANWTWETFFWTPTPQSPGGPSSKLAASLMPDQVKGAARHYAANAAYVMLMPNGANNTTKGAMSMFGYNPYLEGGFGPSTFTYPNSYNAEFKFGMQTNCMTCHGLALPSNSGQYSTDQYIDLYNTNYYGNQVKLDFAWSIQTALIPDTVPYWNFKK